MDITIQRPPLGPGFWLPSREELLEVEIGQNVKLIFADETGYAERMWVIVTDKTDSMEWTGTLDNEPFDLRGVAHDDEVTFHPLDIIQIYTKE